MIPLLYCVIPDRQYLKNNNILGIIKARREDEAELLMGILHALYKLIWIGQVDIPLNTLMENQGAKTEFKIQVYLYGRVFGTFKGIFIVFEDLTWSKGTFIYEIQ